MNAHDEERMKQLLKQAMPPTCDVEAEHDLWPAMLRRMDSRPAAAPWFDWALACGLAVCAVAFPTWIPMILYYL
jgi:hypothetical protein